MKPSEANRVLEIALTQEIALDRKAANKIAKAKKVFVSHYKDDPRAFIEDYVKIIHGKTNEECEFRMNPAQIELVDAMKDNKWVAAPKARQLGITTLTNALALHHSLFVRNANVICMAMKAENAVENLRRIKTMFKTMPQWVQTLTMEWAEDKGHQNNQQLWSFKSKITNTSNKLEVSSASSEDATRGKTPTMMHWTEVAFSEQASQIFTSVFPALNRRNDSVIVLESTGNGNSGFYYEVCTGVRKGFSVVFMPWFLDLDYTKEGEDLTEVELEYIKDLMGVEEFPKGLTEGQLRWYRDTSEVTGKAKGQQEYPVSVEHVFQATNSSFFAFKTMQKIKTGEPLRFLSFEDGYLQTRVAGPGQVYEQVKTEYEYLLSVDSSEGAHDPSVIIILNPKGEEVLFWREKLQPDDLVRLLDVVGKQYNNAKIVVENNGIGAYVVNALMHQYVYTNLYFDKTGKAGFRTTTGSKPEILSILQDHIVNDKLFFKNPHLKIEMSTFQADTLRATKGPDIFDDCVMASAIAAFAFKENKPKLRYVEETYNDYTRDVYNTSRPRRRFII